MQLKIAVLAVLAGLAFGGSGIRCSNGAFEHDCPNSDPVCCFGADAASSGCCALGTFCDVGNNCKPAPPLPANESSVAEHDVTEDVHIAVGRAVMVGGCMVAFLCIVFGGVYGLLWLRKWRADNAARRALLAELSESSDSDDEVSSDTEAALYASVSSAVRVEGREPDCSVLTCYVCSSAAVNCMFIDCEHAVTCCECASKLKKCPECKQIIRKRKKLFLAA